MPERLQKIIARAGITSRRKAEDLISSGRVTVNGQMVQELGSQADPASDIVCVDGKAIQNTSVRRYLAMNKPKGCITSTHDPEGRPTVMDLLGREASKGLFPVGRLDYNTEGLLLLTDDGDFANQIITAKNKIIKVYEVKVSGRPSWEAIGKLRSGIKLDGRPARVESIRLLRDADNPWYEMTLVAGRNRQIHRMFERIGFLIEKIRRVRIGNLTLRGLEPRQVRELQPKEIQQLLNPPDIPSGLDRTEGPPRRELFRERRSAGRSSRNHRDGRPARQRDSSSARDERPPRRRNTFSARDERPSRGRDSSSERGDLPSRRREAFSDRDERPSRGRDASSPKGGYPRRNRPSTDRSKRSDQPRRPPTQRQSTASGSRSRPRPNAREGSPRRSQAQSRAPRNSRPGSRPRP